MRRPVIPLRALLTLGALSAFGPLSMDLYLPALPQLAEDLHTSAATAQLTMSACVIGLAVGQLFLGPVGDRYGRRRPLLIGVGAYAVTSLLCALAPDIGLLVALRLVQGLAGGAGLVLARAVVRDLYDIDVAAHVFSLLMLVSGVAPVVAPVAGGQLLRITGWPGLFVALSLIGCLLLAGAAWAIPESLPPDARERGGLRTVRRQFGAVLRDGHFLTFTAVMAFGTVMLFCYISMSPFVLQSAYGLTAQQFSFVFAANSLGIVAAGRISAWLVHRRGASRTLSVGVLVALFFSCAVLLVAALGGGLPVLLPVLLPAVSSVALIMPSATALALHAHGSRAGTASGVIGLAQFGLGGVIAPLVSSGGSTATLMAATMTGAAAAATLLKPLAGRPARTVSTSATEAPAITAAPETVVLPEPPDPMEALRADPGDRR